MNEGDGNNIKKTSAEDRHCRKLDGSYKSWCIKNELSHYSARPHRGALTQLQGRIELSIIHKTVRPIWFDHTDETNSYVAALNHEKNQLMCQWFDI